LAARTTLEKPRCWKPTALINGLKSILGDIFNETYDTISIIRDLDNAPVEDKLTLINNALKAAFPDANQQIEAGDTLVPFAIKNQSSGDTITIHIACHFVGLNGKGEIEDILKAIRKQPSPVADCIDAHLPDCLGLKEEALKDEDLVKLWPNHYQRYDTLPKQERTGDSTSWENMMQRRATALFDFDRPLTDLQALIAFPRRMTQK